MWLQYSADAENKLIEVENVLSGITNLKYPYCASALKAKKGRDFLPSLHLENDCRVAPKRSPTRYDSKSISFGGGSA